MTIKSNYWYIPAIFLTFSLLWLGVSSDIMMFAVNKYNLDSYISIAILRQWKFILYVLLSSILLYGLTRNLTLKSYAKRNDFKRLFDYSPLPKLIYDINTYEIILVNRAAILQYGYRKSEFQEMTIFDIFPEFEKKGFQSALKKQKKRIFRINEVCNKEKCGRLFYVNIFSFKTTYNGKTCRILNTVDVDEKIRIQAEKENIQSTLDKAAHVIVTDANYSITDVNNEICNFTGYSRKELIGHSPSILKSGYHEESFYSCLTKKFKSGETLRTEIRNKKKDGELYWVDMVIKPYYDRAKSLSGYISVAYDITEKKNLQDTQEKLLTDFSEYAFQTSHKLRGPLTTMMALIELIKRGENPEFYIEKLRKTSFKMDDVIHEMNNSLNRNSFDLISSMRSEKKIRKINLPDKERKRN